MAVVKLSVKTSGFGKIEGKLKSACKKAAHDVAVQAAKDTEPYVPARALAMSDLTMVQDNLIIYPGPYARYLYYGKLMVDPDTGSAWAKPGASKVLTDKNLVFSQAVHGKAQSHWFEASEAMNGDEWKEAAEKAVKKYLG